MNHVNLVGATKVSKHFSTYLAHTFNLQDKRSDNSYKKTWDEAGQIYERWVTAYELRNMVKLKDYIEKVRAEDYVVLFTTVSDLSLDTVSEGSLELCRELGLLEQEKLQGHYIALMEDGQKPYVVERAALNSKLEELGIPIEVGYDERDRHTLSNIDYKKHN